jgi:hypothetical protein
VDAGSDRFRDVRALTTDRSVDALGEEPVRSNSGVAGSFPPDPRILSRTTTIITFLLQNSQTRSDQALQHKLNAIAGGLSDLMEGRGGAELAADGLRFGGGDGPGRLPTTTETPKWEPK